MRWFWLFLIMAALAIVVGTTRDESEPEMRRDVPHFWDPEGRWGVVDGKPVSPGPTTEEGAENPLGNSSLHVEILRRDGAPRRGTRVQLIERGRLREPLRGVRDASLSCFESRRGRVSASATLALVVVRARPIVVSTLGALALVLAAFPRVGASDRGENHRRDRNQRCDTVVH